MTLHPFFSRTTLSIGSAVAVAALLLPGTLFAQQSSSGNRSTDAQRNSQSTQRGTSTNNRQTTDSDTRNRTGDRSQDNDLFDRDDNRADRDNSRFDRDNNRFDRDENRFDRDDNRFDRDDNRFDRDDNRFDRDNNRFDRDDNVFDRDNNRFDRDDNRFDRDSNRFDRDDDSDTRNGNNRNMDIGADFSTDASDRLVVRTIQSRGILANAGLRQNDVIVSVDGRGVTSASSLNRVLIAADGRVPLVVLRDGSRRTIYVDDIRQQRYRTDYDYEDGRYQTFDSQRGWLGVYLDTRYDNYAVVQSVQDGSAADKAGIRSGDWIISVNNRRVQSPSHLSQLVGNMDPDDSLDLEVARWDRRQVSATVSERPSSAQRFRYLDDENMDRRDDRNDRNRGDNRNDDRNFDRDSSRSR